MRKILITTLLAAFAAIGSGMPAHAAISDSDFQKGVTLVPRAPADFASAAFKLSLRNAAQAGANYATLVVPLHQENIYTSNIYAGPDTPDDASLAAGIDYAHGLGMHVMVKIHLYNDTGMNNWGGYIEATDRNTWFANYNAEVMHYAKLSEAHAAEILCIGNELWNMTLTENHPDTLPQWTGIIQNVRAAFSGKLTYSANRAPGNYSWDEASRLAFWDQLDYVGFSPYFTLTDDRAGSWQAVYQSYILPIEQKFHKPILFTEIGYSSIQDDKSKPWWWMGGELDLAEQAADYDALFAFVSMHPEIKGVHLWQWDINPDAGGLQDNSYTPQNKPAQNVMAKWFGGDGGVLSITASAPGAVPRGRTIVIKAAVSGGGKETSNIVADFEIYDASNRRVLQKYYQGQNYIDGQISQYEFKWKPLKKGTYILRGGTFNAAWNSYSWQDNLAVIR